MTSDVLGDERCTRCHEIPQRLAILPDGHDVWLRVRCSCRRPRWLLVVSSSDRPRTSSPATDERDAMERALEIWRAALPAPGTLAETYLCARGITIPPPPSLRYQPRCWYGLGDCRPAMIAAVQDVRDDVTGVQRTWLAPNGSQRLERRMLGRCRGGAVRFGAAAETLAVAEGIETALSVMQARGIPTWAALSTSGLTALDLPEIVREVVIVADGDSSGISAAERAAERWTQEGRRVRIGRPPAGADANDLLRRAGEAAA